MKLFLTNLRNKNPLVIVFIILFSLISCSQFKIDTTLNSLEVTPTFCPTIVSPLTWEFENDSQLIFILVDGSLEYTEYSSQMNNILINILPSIINPGDRLVLSWTGENSLSNAVFLDMVVEDIPTPDIEAFTMEIPTSQSTPEIGMYYSRVAKVAATEAAKQTQTASQLLATQSVNEYYCELNGWQEKSLKIYDEWVSERDVRIDDFVTSYQMTMESFDYTRTKIPISNIYESLYLATKFVQEEERLSEQDNSFDKKIVIFSSLYDVRNFDEYFGPPIDFTDIDVIIVLQDCKYLYDETPQCRDKVSYWSGVFEQYNPRSVLFVSSNNIEENLIDCINGR